MNQRTSNLLFYIGILFLIIGGIGLTFMAFFAVIGLPIFIVGMILIFLGQRSLKSKLIWISSFVILILLFWPIWTKINTAKPETYLIPDNYTGKIKIVYGEDCGINPPIQNGRRILTIPNNGILIIQPEFESGIIDHQYYFVNGNGEKTKIEHHENYANGTKNIPGIGLGRSGNFPGAMPNGGFSSESPSTINFTEFQVLRDSIYKNNFKEERKFDSIAKKLVKECREKTVYNKT